MKLTDHSASFSSSLLGGQNQEAKIQLIHEKNIEATKVRNNIAASSSASETLSHGESSEYSNRGETMMFA